MSSATLCAGAKTRSLYANRHEVSVTAAIVIAMVATQPRTVSTGGNVNAPMTSPRCVISIMVIITGTETMAVDDRADEERLDGIDADEAHRQADKGGERDGAVE